MSNPKRILLVEDDALIALDAEDVLVSAGYVVVGPAGTLVRAKQLAATEPLAAAVLDVNLNGLYIWPVAELLHNRGIPFLLLTGFSAGLEMPAFCRSQPHLRKPVMADVLLEALLKIIRD
jgi:DNA-binding response OmpR family regulator